MKKQRRTNVILRYSIRWVLVWIGFGALLVAGSTMMATELPETVLSDDHIATNPEEKVSYQLTQLIQPNAQLQSTKQQTPQAHLSGEELGSIVQNKQGDILTYIRMNNLSRSNVHAITRSGAQIRHIDREYGIITAYINPQNVLSVASGSAVQNIQEVLQPVSMGNLHSTSSSATTRPQSTSCVPGIVSEGDTQLRASAARTNFDIDGSGITVGVLSDTFDESGMHIIGADDDIESGDLPGPGNPCNRTTPVNIIAEGESAGSVDEGRAMLQIIHDLAPGADLAFATAYGGVFEFADNIRQLQQSANANVIVDDIVYHVEPFFQDGPVDVAIRDVVNNGATYFTAVGNLHVEDERGNSIGSYEADAYRPIPCPIVTGDSGAVQPGKDCHDFDPGPGTDNRLHFKLGGSGQLKFVFQWAEPWFGVETDLDITIVDEDNNVLRESRNVNIGQSGTQFPYESLFYAKEPQDVYLIISRAAGDETPRLKYILLRQHALEAVEYSSIPNGDTFGPTVFGHLGAEPAISVGAVPYNDSETPEDFSSRGDPTVYFGPVDSRNPAPALAEPATRQKPDLVASNNTQNTFFVNTGNGYRFEGTSAAAPHAAAIAALMKEQATRNDNILSPQTIAMIMKEHADSLENGSRSSSGAGLINALDAVGVIEQNEVTPMPTATSTSTPAPVAPTATLAPSEPTPTATSTPITPTIEPSVTPTAGTPVPTNPGSVPPVDQSTVYLPLLIR
ncbi:MAG: S8 family serine peptidase [Chloroflexota bacterium]